MSTTLTLPDDVLLCAEQWLDSIDARVARLETATVGLSASDAASLRAAIADVRASTLFAKKMFSGAVSLGTRADDRWVPITKPGPELAAAIFANGYEFAETPFALLERAKALLAADTYNLFRLEVSHVLASLFTNLTRAVWNDYPEYAPPAWGAPG